MAKERLARIVCSRNKARTQPKIKNNIHRALCTENNMATLKKLGNTTRPPAGRIPPHNLEAEQSVLGCCLIDAQAANYVIGALDAGDFYLEQNTEIFSAIRNISQRSAPVDLITLSDELERQNKMAGVGGMSYLSALTVMVPGAANHKWYCEIVKKNSTLRRIINASNLIVEKAFNENEDDIRGKNAQDDGGNVPVTESVLGYAEKLIFDIGASLEKSDLTHVSGSAKKVFGDLEKIHRDKSLMRGIPTGFTLLDSITNGLQNSDLILIAARPSVGKTALGLNIVQNIARLTAKRTEDGSRGSYKCAVFNLEMSAEQLYQRMLCSMANVPMTDALSGKLKQDGWSAVWAARKGLESTEVYIDDSAVITPVEILSKCRRLKREKGLDVVLIDYLQLMYSGKRAENRQADVAEISRRLKIAAKELDVPVILLSQMSREVEKRPGHKPQLSDLRESGAIEQDADIVIFIHRKHDINDEAIPKELRNEVELHIAKHRNGATGVIPLYWNGETITFRNYDKRL